MWRATSKNFVAQASRLPQLEAERQSFAFMLIKLICDGVPVMYFDETSFQLEMTMRRAFYPRQNKLVLPIPRGQRRGFSLYGCIGSCVRGGAYFEVHDSSNKEDFMAFMRNLEGQLIQPELPVTRRKRPVLVLDNLAAHKGADRLLIMERFAQVQFIPAYSCQLQGPIEAVWSLVKRRVRPKFTELQLRDQCTRARCIELVQQTLEEVEVATFANLLRVHYRYLVRTFQQVQDELSSCFSSPSKKKKSQL